MSQHGAQALWGRETMAGMADGGLGKGPVETARATPVGPPPPPPSPGGGGGSGGTSQTVPDAPTNLLLESGDGQVTLTWDAPEDDGGSAITDYEYRINGQGDWISIGSTDTTTGGIDLHRDCGELSPTRRDAAHRPRKVRRIGRGERVVNEPGGLAVDRSDAKITVRRILLSACIVHAEWIRE